MASIAACAGSCRVCSWVRSCSTSPTGRCGSPTAGLIASENTRAYYEFENAFPLADAWLGVACLLAWWTLTTRRPSALFWLLCAGSAGAYLFCMDLLYDLENGIFTSGSGGVVEAAHRGRHRRSSRSPS